MRIQEQIQVQAKNNMECNMEIVQFGWNKIL